MEIKLVDINEIKPYKNNPRHNDDAVEYVKRSIEEFGMKVPLVIDRNNEIVTGHTRYKACKELGMKEIPCIMADDLSDEQVKAFRLADNKVAEKASWDYSLLDLELDDIVEFNMEDFGFEFMTQEEHEEHSETTQNRVENIQNLGIAQYEGVGYYDIPQLEPVKKLPEIKEWIGFNYVLSDDDPTGKAVHFFIDDYQFERIWNDPEKYVEKLKQYVCVATPDFSPYGDMPMILQIYNHYRKHWVGSFLQQHGVTVIPTIRASSDERSYDWYLEGEPTNGIVIISSMWASKNEEIHQEFLKEFNTMKEKLKPSKIFIYGKEVLEVEGNIEYVDTFTSKRWEEK